ncbi:DNA polymerase III subunit gamma/tau [Microbacterium sp. zg.Y1090]|uniref:DNA polymerase III subunit gamma/tau n=1 Tax=Microbacterium TaxID=33882 RepID=UPI00214BA835|nr:MULTISPECIES: DNA polymerase III subunit gamma/tau [unclassified Microbacterium]MCR2811583.1 DNA polymerase III subunit gamma/tau [Microbacterium sp. zg.Y1084]MCR2818995.1 DNA polymerase III subunit gamma/tau [Microbacterium sp. zg.Y1090]MDL5487645.1 DNA polymerase III subunit gamma/tau [Microbacterium sp. zg-Y1211]WIM27300.1 DNA polymerase III subunit gamma/tau [Microbacterium sp. zg-Y1090]
MARTDDEALSWEGDDDPTLAPGPAAPALPDGYRAVGKGSEQVGADSDADAAEGLLDTADAAAPGMSNAALVGVGVFAGVYLLLSIGWLLGGARLQLVAQLFLDPVAFQITLWMAVLAPPIWFGTVFLLTRASRVWVRMVLLAAGAVLLVPWPFVLAGVTL